MTDLNISLRMLKKVLSIQSKSCYNKDDKLDIDIRNYIKSVLASEKIEHHEDTYGNIYAVKGKADLYNCVVAHVDTVHSIEKEYEIKRLGDFLYAFNPYDVCQVGIGGDDKVGVYIALQILKDMDSVKAVFYRNEEIGCRGSNHSISHYKDFYKDCKFIVENDRRGNKDFITKSGGIDICSKEFKEDAKEIYERYQYKEETGLSSDVDTLVRGGVGISVVNLSCGYYRPHDDNEIVHIYDVNDAYNLTYDLFNELTDKYEYEYTPPKTTTHYSYWSGGATGPIVTSDNIYKQNDQAEVVYSTMKEDETDTKHKHFVKLVGTALYKVRNIENSEIFMKDHKCGTCGKKSAVYFLPDENEFYCISCNDFIIDYEESGMLRKKLAIKDSGSTFYHNRTSNRWIKNKAVWDSNFIGYRSNHYAG